MRTGRYVSTARWEIPTIKSFQPLQTMSLFAATLVAGLVLLAFYRWQQRSIAEQSKTAAGGAVASQYRHLEPLLGIDLFIETCCEYLRGKLCEGMRRRHEKYGPTYSALQLGRRSIFTIEVDNIRTITDLRFNDWAASSWVEEGKKHIGPGILMNDGEAWRHSRSRLKPLFARTSIDELNFLEPHVKGLIAAIEHLGDRQFDFSGLASSLMLDVVTDFLTGQPTKTLRGLRAAPEDDFNFLEDVDEFDPVAAAFIGLGPLAFLSFVPKYRIIIFRVERMQRWFRARLESGVKIHSQQSERHSIAGQARPAERPSLLHLLHQHSHPAQDAQGELQNVFFASYDTTRTLLSNVIGVIGAYPAIQERVRREVGELHGKPPTTQDLAGMRYLGCFIKEGKFGGAALSQPILTGS